MKFSALILALAAAVAQAGFFRNDFLPVGHVRTDAIINPNCLSDHVHTFYGPPLLYPKVSFEDLRNSDPNLSSGNIMENQSLYWHPAVYHVAADGKKTLQESEMTTVYYNWIPGQTRAFPAGFRMITPGAEVFDEGITPGASEMELNISFQSCWDGINLDSPDHKSHVAFPEGEDEDARCPSSHPVRIPRLDFFIRWFNTPPAKWRFSDGNRTMHADYISGWDEDFLQSLLDGGDGDVDSKVTFRSGILHQGSDSDLIQQMNANAVPKADTSCITTEVIDNVYDLPRGVDCNGALISPYGVCGTPFPAPVTSKPTSSPTKSPTSSPTVGITSGPTQSPTSSPTVGITSSPTKSPTSSPTVGITSSPTQSPTSSPTVGITSSPTKSPTKAPSSNEEDVCRDSDTKFTLQSGAMKHCKWVSWNRDARCSKRTYDNKLIADVCPVTCPDPVTEEPVCTPVDNTSSFLVNGTSRTCAWANHANDDIKGDRCENFVVLANCPVTCEEFV